MYLGEAEVGETTRTTWQLALFVVGGVVTIAGVSMLIKHQPESPSGNELLHTALQSGEIVHGTAGAHAPGSGANVLERGRNTPFDLMGDTFPIHQSLDGADNSSDTAVPGLFRLSRQSLEHMSSHDQTTVEEAMAYARRDLALLQQENASLRSDVAWRTEVLERAEADLAAALGDSSLEKGSARAAKLNGGPTVDIDLIPDSAQAATQSP